MPTPRSPPQPAPTTPPHRINSWASAHTAPATAGLRDLRCTAGRLMEVRSMNSGSSNPLRTAGRMSSEYGITEPTTRHASAGAAAVCISSMALALGVVTIARAALHTHPTGLAVTIGFGAMIAAIALWSLLVTDPTYL